MVDWPVYVYRRSRISGKQDHADSMGGARSGSDIVSAACFSSLDFRDEESGAGTSLKSKLSAVTALSQKEELYGEGGDALEEFHDAYCHSCALIIAGRFYKVFRRSVYKAFSLVVLVRRRGIDNHRNVLEPAVGLDLQQR